MATGATLPIQSEYQSPVALNRPSSFKLSSAASNNPNLVKAAPGQLLNMAVSNVNAAARYLKLYDKASAPTVGTDVPLLTVPLAANSVLPVDFGALGLPFVVGIALAITAGVADSDVAVVGAADVKVVLSFN